MEKKLFIGLSLLLTLASCGKDDKKTSRVISQDPICEDVSCLSTVNWKIQLLGRNFPQKARVDINGTTVLNECVSKQKFSINRWSEPQNLYLENYVIPKQGDLKIQVIDLGHCDQSVTFIDNRNVTFDLVKTGLDRELVINL